MVSGPEEARRTVREQIGHVADLIKVSNAVGFFERCTKMTPGQVVWREAKQKCHRGDFAESLEK